MTLCPECNHPALIHIHGMCSNAKCYCTETLREIPQQIADTAQWYSVLHISSDNDVLLWDGVAPSESWERGKGTIIITVSNHGLQVGDSVCLGILAVKKGEEPNE